MRPKSILNAYQKKFLQAAQGDNYISGHFYLAGGTTLAQYYLHHRLSDDLDFFTSDEDINIRSIENFLEENKEKLGVAQRQRIKRYDRNICNLRYTDGFELKTEFTKYFKPLYPLAKIEGLHVEHINDIFLNKIACILDRNDPKDFVDLYYMWHDARVDTTHILERVKKKFLNTVSDNVLSYALFK
jgi:predicted nucleotidyltransferase component of viral defense system